MANVKAELGEVTKGLIEVKKELETSQDIEERRRLSVKEKN